LIILSIIFVFIISVEERLPEVTSTNTSEFLFYSVTQVIDGDVIEIKINGKDYIFRLIGLDTPESVDPIREVQCFGKEASDKAKELLFNKKVRIETDISQGTTDKYGRILAYVYREDGLFYNKYMIEQGYAREYTYGTVYKYQSEFKTAQKNAEASQLGLWSPGTCNGKTTSVSTQTTTHTHPSMIAQSSGSFYYTSARYNAKYYYPEVCEAWKELSPTFLKSSNNLEALLLVYPARTKSPLCR
jgi:endonuclease YncB( thermonuclease family)